MSKSSKKKRVAITFGDPAGVGPEVIAKALSARKLPKATDYIVIGNQDVYSRYSKDCNQWPDFVHVEKGALRTIKLGKPSAKTGLASLLYLQKGVELLQSGKVDALVTGPLSKEAVCQYQKGFCGHTEYLANAFGKKHVGMMFVASRLKTIIVTRHIPLTKVAKEATEQEILDTICLSNWALKYNFKIKRPKIAVCGVNPHAGENGLIGIDEIKTVIPAIKKAKRKGVVVEGPFPADTLFVPHNSSRYDLIVAMYHDQGLIPVKMNYFNELVNLTIGLPFIRTSPAHGTAFDIAGKGVAHEGSMLSAIKLAAQLSVK